MIQLVLGHDIGAGSSCFKCACPGLELHYWRKICKICSCRMDDHDVILPENMDHGKVIIGRLFDVIPEFERKLNISTRTLNKMNSEINEVINLSSQKRNMVKSLMKKGNDKCVELITEYTWLPSENRSLAEKYFAAIPENERPIVGSEGAKDRRKKLQYQLPNHDSNADMAKSLVSEADHDQFTKYLTVVKRKIVGVGKLIECNNSVRNSNGEKQKLNKNANKKKDYGKCNTCGIFMQPGDVAIVTDHGSPDNVWHPNCFRCQTCNQRLVDLLYFYKDGNYFCGRHFGESLYCRCAGCDELIFSKEYTYAEEKNWHFDHFCCFGCDKQLGGHRYMMKDEQPYCFACYMIRFAKTCRFCLNKIAPDEQRISFKELHWHAQHRCFHCQNCNMELLNRKFVIKTEKVFCSTECKKDFFSRIS
ncbi:unnamed protein product [Dracunculus medinensis]|uniref:LIM domain protein n=1 Tax=Dracunculus medinensis TaxID=318479 RepID=A0A0N4UDX8_DRAME|nr:unnamed protein product [Dracunculus medinensis]